MSTTPDRDPRDPQDVGADARAARQAKLDAAAPRERRARPLLVALVVLILLAGIGVAVWSGTRGDEAAQNASPSGSTGAYPKGATGPDGGIVINAEKVKAGAPTLDVYEDFQCPACKQIETVLGPTIREMSSSGEAKVVYHVKDFLDANLEEQAAKTGQTLPNPKSSLRAAMAGACAADAGRFEAFHDAVYAAQPEEGKGYTDAQLAQFAQKAGITGAAATTWQQCYGSKKYASYVAKVEDASARAGVTGTPSFQVDGKAFDLQQQQVASAQDFRTKVLAAGK